MSDPLRVLMVEDQAELREMIGTALRDFGIDVHTANDGPDALRVIDETGDFHGRTGADGREDVYAALPSARLSPRRTRQGASGLALAR